MWRYTAHMAAVQDVLGRWNEYDVDRSGSLNLVEVKSLVTALVALDEHGDEAHTIEPIHEVTPGGLMTAFGEGTPKTIDEHGLENMELHIIGCLVRGPSSYHPSYDASPSFTPIPSRAQRSLKPELTERRHWAGHG